MTPEQIKEITVHLATAAVVATAMAIALAPFVWLAVHLWKWALG